MTRIILYIALILAIYGTFVATTIEEKSSCMANRELEQQCASYTYKVVQVLLDFIRNMKNEINQSQVKDIEIKDLKEKLIQKDFNTATNNDLRSQIAFLQRTIDKAERTKSTDQCNQLVKELADKDEQIASLNLINTENVRRIQLQLEESQNKYVKQQKDLQLCQIEVDNINNKIKEHNSRSCFGYSSGVQNIKVPGIDAFDVLCVNQTAGNGWTVIEQRVNGGESFNRDWVTFRNGFGSFDGDFFLGLEKIHRLTVDQSHELYIHMERFNGRIDQARYDRFLIGSEDDKYRISILGKFSGNVEDNLRPHAHLKFSTFDSDNDNWDNGSCAQYREGGWWYDSCVHSFLHGIYYNRSSVSFSSIYFNYPHTVKTLKIMIRPIT